jgi:Protein of unknown function (DUF1264)
VAPGIPDVAEKELMKKLVTTYGKTWHTWHTDQGKSLPLGVPQLMMGFTADGQHDAKMVAERDKRLGVDSAAKRKDREDIAAPPIDPGADAWQKGKVVQLADPTGLAHPQHGASAPTPASAPASGAQPAASGSKP